MYTWIGTLKLGVVNPGPEIGAVLPNWHGQQRLTHNLTLAASRDEGRLAALQKSPFHPNGLLGRLTPPEGAFAQDERLDKEGTPLWVHRAGVVSGRTAAKLHGEHCKALARKVKEDLRDEEAWAKWMSRWDAKEQERLRTLWEDPKTRRAWLKEHGKTIPKRVARCIRGPRVVNPRVRPLKSRLRRKRRERRIRLTSLVPGKRIDDYHLGIGRGVVLETTEKLPPEWAMVSFQVVEVTPWIGRKTRDEERQLKLHVQVKIACIASSHLKGEYARWVGADLGVTHTITLSDGTTWSLPDRKDLEEKLVALQREMAQCNRGSWRWRRALGKLRKVHRTAVHRDENAMWHFANKLASEYDVVVLEDLLLKAMSSSAKGSVTHHGSGVAQKRGLNRALRRASLGKLKEIICRAFEKRRKTAKVVDPRGTSTTCHACSHKDPDSRKSQAEFRCTKCGYEANADVNAAQNVRTRGWTETGPPPWTGQGLPLDTGTSTEAHLRSPPGSAQPPWAQAGCGDGLTDMGSNTVLEPERGY